MPSSSVNTAAAVSTSPAAAKPSPCSCCRWRRPRPPSRPVTQQMMSKSWTPQSRKRCLRTRRRTRASGGPGRGWWGGRCAAIQLAGGGRVVRGLVGDVEAPLVADLYGDARGPHPSHHLDALGESAGQRLLAEHGEPASTAARISSGWASVQRLMTTPSNTASNQGVCGEATGSAPRRSATLVVRPGMMSATTSGVEHGQAGQGVGVELADPPEQSEAHGGLLPFLVGHRRGPPVLPGRRRPPGRRRRTWPRWRGGSAP